MDFTLSLIALLASAYFAKEAYDNYRIGIAMIWASLVGWNLHTILGLL
jgi:hypothetical protein